jgi:hypothetical protein
MASAVDICNRALQRLGAAKIQSLGESSVNARACLMAYELVRDAVLRAHPWNFAIQRFQVAADATPPAFNYANSFTLPTGSLKVLPPDPSQNFNDRDWIIEGRKLLTNDAAPLNLRCVMKVDDTTLMDPLFCEALAAKLAYELCEAITQSNEKQQNCLSAYKMIVEEAKKSNAIEKVPQTPVDDSWATIRM